MNCKTSHLWLFKTSRISNLASRSRFYGLYFWAKCRMFWAMFWAFLLVFLSENNWRMGGHEIGVNIFDTTQIQALAFLVWTSRLILLLSCLCFRHSQCELDFSCPYFVLLQCIEKKVLLESADEQRVESIDQHFVSCLHFSDFRNKKGSRHLTSRTRHLINSILIDMGQMSSCEQNLKLWNKKTQKTIFVCRPRAHNPEARLKIPSRMIHEYEQDSNKQCLAEESPEAKSSHSEDHDQEENSQDSPEESRTVPKFENHQENLFVWLY